MRVLLSDVIRLISFDIEKHPLYEHLTEAKKQVDLGRFNEVKKHLDTAEKITTYLSNASSEESKIKGPLGDRAKKRFQILSIIKQYLDQAQEKTRAQRDTEINPLIDFALNNLRKLPPV